MLLERVVQYRCHTMLTMDRCSVNWKALSAAYLTSLLFRGAHKAFRCSKHCVYEEPRMAAPFSKPAAPFSTDWVFQWIMNRPVKVQSLRDVRNLAMSPFRTLYWLCENLKKRFQC